MPIDFRTDSDGLMAQEKSKGARRKQKSAKPTVACFCAHHLLFGALGALGPRFYHMDMMMLEWFLAWRMLFAL